MSKKELLDLPNEILANIAEFCADRPRDVRALCLVSKRFHDIAVRVLYRDIKLINEEPWASKLLLATLVKKKEYAGYVRGIEVMDFWTDRWGSPERARSRPIVQTLRELDTKFEELLDQVKHMVMNSNSKLTRRDRIDWSFELGKDLIADLALILTVCPNLVRFSISLHEQVVEGLSPYHPLAMICDSTAGPPLNKLKSMEILDIELASGMPGLAIPVGPLLEVLRIKEFRGDEDSFESIQEDSQDERKPISLVWAESTTSDTDPKLRFLDISHVTMRPSDLLDFLESPSARELRTLKFDLVSPCNNGGKQADCDRSKLMSVIEQNSPQLEELVLRAIQQETSQPCGECLASLASFPNLARLTADTHILLEPCDPVESDVSESSESDVSDPGPSGPIPDIFARIPASVVSLNLTDFPLSQLEAFSERMRDCDIEDIERPPRLEKVSVRCRIKSVAGAYLWLRRNPRIQKRIQKIADEIYAHLGIVFELFVEHLKLGPSSIPESAEDKEGRREFERTRPPPNCCSRQPSPPSPW